MTRPKRTPADKNQGRQNDKLRFWGCRCIVTSDLPGKRHVGKALENPLDTLVLSPCKRFLLLVEWKIGPREKLTANEREFFDSIGILDCVGSGLEPTEMWLETGIPVVVAWEAEQVIDVFSAMESFTPGRVTTFAMSLSEI